MFNTVGDALTVAALAVIVVKVVTTGDNASSALNVIIPIFFILITLSFFVNFLITYTIVPFIQKYVN